VGLAARVAPQRTWARGGGGGRRALGASGGATAATPHPAAAVALITRCREATGPVPR